MSHKKILELAKKFASTYNSDELKKEKIITFFERFKQHFRILLNEMEGDYMTIKVKGIDKNILKNFHNLYQNLLEFLKKFDDKLPIENIITYIFAKPNRLLINTLNDNIQNFLKENEINFLPNNRFSQAKVNSLTNLLKLIISAHRFLNDNQQITVDTHHEKLQNEKEDYTPIGGSIDTTKIEKRN